MTNSRESNRTPTAPWRRFGAIGLTLSLAFAAACSDGPGSVEPPSIERAFIENGATLVDLTAQGAFATINGAQLISFNPATSTGTGVYSSFVRVSSNRFDEEGYNTSGRPVQFDENTSPSFTKDLRLDAVPQQPCGFGPPGALCREFNADINQTSVEPLLDLLRVRLFVSTTPSLNRNSSPQPDPNSPTFGQGAGTSLVWDLDGGAQNVYVRFNYNNSTGSGGGDVKLLVPVANFPPEAEAACPYDAGTGGNDCGYYIYLYSQWGTTNGAAAGNGENNDGFEEWNTRKAAYVRVTKTAQTSFTRTHSWDIVKSVEPSTINLFPGQSADAEYTVQVVYNGFVDSDWAVQGTITILNESTQAAEIASVSDIISGGPEGDIPVAPNCGVAFPHTLAAGATLVCTYSQDLTSGDTRLNTARATLVDAGVNTGTAAIDFSTATINHIDESATVTDTYDSGEFPVNVDAPNAPTITYTRTFTCDEDQGEHNNIATITADDTGTPHSDNASVFVNCGHLTVTKDAATSLTRTWNWTIEKTVTPDTWDLFTGDAGTSEYTVTVDKVDFTDSNWAVTGSIFVENDGTVDAELSGVSDEIDGVGAATVVCPVSFPYTLPVGGILECTYSQSLPDGTNRENTATASIVNDGSFSGTATVDFSNPTVTEVNPEINVDDTYAGSLGSFSDDGSTSYQRTFTCDADEGTHDNTATIVETGQSDDASVTVNCHALTVVKDAATELTRTWAWQLVKEVDASFFAEETYDAATNTATIQDGELLDVTFKITGTATPTDSDWKVSGKITISNPHPSRAAGLTGVADVAAGTNATVDCPALSVPSGGTLDCTYSADLPGAVVGSNVATATLQNNSFDPAGAPTPTGTTDFVGTFDFNFDGAAITEVDKCIDLTDELSGTGVLEQGTPAPTILCADGPLVSFVTFTFGGEGVPYVCGPNEYLNTVTGITQTNGITVIATAPVNILVECAEGCTLTPGYWMTHTQSHRDAHNGKGPPIDPRWEFIGDADDDGIVELEAEEFFLSGMTYYAVMAAPVAGNQYYNLAGHYIAAVLNSQAAFVPPEVQAAIDAATLLFETWTPAQIADLKGKKGNDLRKEFVDLAGILGSYNEGIIGPGHCTENTNPA